MGGPGERQIESDKRQISKRISKIKNELKKCYFKDYQNNFQCFEK